MPRLPDGKPDMTGYWAPRFNQAIFDIEDHPAARPGIPPGKGAIVDPPGGKIPYKPEAAAKAKGVSRVCVPNRSTKSPERKREQKKRWFRNGQKWRTGSEGRISVVKRRHGLDRCRYKGDNGMRRWVGWSVIGDSLLTVGNAMAKNPPRRR